MQHNQMMLTVEDPQVGETRQMGIPVTLVDNPGKIKGPAPRLGEHTHDVLRELGYPEERIGELANKGII